MLLFIILDKIYSVVNVVFSHQTLNLFTEEAHLTISTFKEETIIDSDAIANLRLQKKIPYEVKINV